MSPGLDRAAVVASGSLVQAAIRRRAAERAFEDYVREMARRWAPRKTAAPARAMFPKV